MSGVLRLAKVAWQEEGQTAHEFTGAFITGVNSDGTVRVSYLDEEHPSVAAMSYYTNRQIGDNVLIRSNGDHWIVLGRIGFEDVLSIPPSAPVLPTIGTLLPYTSTRFHAHLYSGTTWLFDEPTMITPMAQGQDPATDRWASAWYFNQVLRDAIIAGSFSKVEIKFVRNTSVHGSSGAVSPVIYMHTLPQPTSDLIVTNTGPFTGPALTRGAEGWWEMPTTLVDSIKGGANWRGFYIESISTSNYFLCKAGIGAGTTGEVRTTTPG